MPNILVVEDSLAQAEQARLILEPEGFAVDIARDGRAALERLDARTYDLVLSDIVMPGMSGYDLCLAIKGDQRTRSTPVVLLTQLTDPLDVLRGLECGADNFLTKPFDPHYLLHRIRTMLAHAGGSGLMPVGTSLFFRGKGVTITADKAQILDLLLAALEEFVRARERERAALAAGEALAEAGRRKDLFVAMLAHELRNPLAPLLTGLHVLRRGDVDHEGRALALEAAERQVRHLSRLVEDLLDTSRVTVGQMRLRRERLDLARLVRTTVEDRRPALDQNGLLLTVEAPEAPVWVHGDEARLAQVMHNLLENAAKFTDPGGEVRVLLVVNEIAREATVSVKDTGAGIEAGTLSRLFEVFTQADRTLERTRGGLGLGLAVVRGVIEQHGGQVQAFSDGPGRGAELTFRLPTEQEPAALAGRPQQSAAPVVAARVRVVVIEDNRDAADLLKLFLEARGHDVVVAYTGPEGVQAVQEMRPGAVISDIGLPGLDGYGVAAALRGDPATAGVLLIGVSGYGRDEDIRRAREVGFDHYLVKPAPPEELARLLTAGAL